jgi:hypothetical protein
MVFLFLGDSVQGTNPTKYGMLIKMGSEVLVAASFLWVDLTIIHHKTSDTLRLALYQTINGNWQNYEQIICFSLS